MTDPLRKVQENDPLDGVSARAWNSFIDAAQDFRDRQAGQSSPGDQTEILAGILPVKNASGNDLARFDPIGLSFPLWDPTEADQLASFKERPAFIGYTPNDDAWGIYLEPVPAGAIGRALVSGVVQCQVDIVDESHDFCTAEDGALVSDVLGCGFMLWKEAGTGTRWALVRISNSPEAENDSSSGTDTESATACATIPGVDFDSLPTSTDPQYVLAIENGCLVKVAVGDCAGGGSASGNP